MEVRLLGRIAVDLLAWCLLPAAFLFLYVGQFGLSDRAVVPHLKLVLIAWLVIGSTRILLSSLVRRESLARLMASAVVAAALLLMVVYYGAVLAGLASWGQVISWDLIRSYSLQLPALAGSLEIPMALIAAAVAVLYLLLLFAARAFIATFDWGSLLVRSASRGVLGALMGGCAAFIGIELATFSYDHSGGDDEPVALTLFPIENARALQDHGIDRLAAKHLDRLEDAARSTYVDSMATNPVNVVLIVVDALRPDHLGVYGYSRDTTPLLDRMARSGQLRIVRGAHASCTESACGLLSLASSKYVHQFSDRPITLYEILRRHGYRVHLILGGDHTSFYGLRAAYGPVDTYFDGSDAAVTSTVRYANDDQLVIDRAAGLPNWDGKPVMMQFHLMSAHQLGRRHEDSLKFSPSSNYTLRFRKNASRNAFINYYDNGVFQADAMIERLLGTLQRKGYLQRALVVITADHGESLGEHGQYVHSHSVIESSLRIPLMFAAYGYNPKAPFRSDGVSQVDIAPTILTELGIGLPGSWVGSPLQSPQEPPIAYFQQKRQVGLIDRTDRPHLWKYWIDRKTNEEYAFELTADPDEHANLVESIPLRRKQEWASLLLKLRPNSTTELDTIE